MNSFIFITENSERYKYLQFGVFKNLAFSILLKTLLDKITFSLWSIHSVWFIKLNFCSVNTRMINSRMVNSVMLTSKIIVLGQN